MEFCRRNKTLIFHIGAPKTGTSAIQAFLSKNVHSLLEQDVFYPWPESEQKTQNPSYSGNLLTKILRLNKETGSTHATVNSAARSSFHQAVHQAVKSSPAQRVLLSGEFMFGIEGFRLVQEAAETYETKVIVCLRNPYDHFISCWKQSVKVGHTHLYREYLAWEIRRKALLFQRLDNLIRLKIPIALISYDEFKSDLISKFLIELDLDPARFIRIDHHEKYNSSISFSQAQLMVMAVRNLGSSRLNALLSNAYISSRNKQKDPYIATIDHLIHQACGDEISNVNALLPERSRVKIAPESDGPEDHVSLNLRDVEIFFDMIQMVRKLPKPTKLSASRVAMGVPEDFDSIEYLLRNPDIRDSGLTPEYHYLNHGRYEGRIYKCKYLLQRGQSDNEISNE